MKKIYLIFTYTGTIPSKIIKLYTRKKFSHISIALDEDLEYMYSFCRLKTYNPIIGGFVHERIHEGVYKRFKNTNAFITSYEVNDNQYDKIKEILSNFEAHKNIYKFNIIGCLAVPLNKKISRKNHFYCAEFIKYLFDEANINNNLPLVVKPEDFMKLNLEEVYQGLLRNYRY